MEQTEGVELPGMGEVYGDVGENHDRLVSFIDRQGIELVFTENIAPALGMSYGGRIAILPGQSKAEEFSTLVHELAHLCCVDSYAAFGTGEASLESSLRIERNITNDKLPFAYER